MATFQESIISKRIQADLAQDYYLKNFKKLVQFVEEKYSDLLTKSEKRFIKDFYKMGQHGQKLFVRMSTRVGPIFRISKFKYPEIDLQKAIPDLEKAGFANYNPNEDIESVLMAMNKPELVQIARTLGIAPKGLQSQPKETTVELLIDEEPWSLIWKQEKFLEPLHQEKIILFRLLFFGNLEQTLSDFILEDIGVLKYEPYEIKNSDRFFTNRDHVEQLLLLIELAMEQWMATEENDLEGVKAIIALVDKIKITHEPLLKRKYRAYNNAARFLEKHQEWKLALKYYKKSQKAPARERMVRIYEKTGEPQKALTLCNKMAKDPWDISEEEFLEHFPEKLKKQLGKEYKKVERECYEQETIVVKKRDEKVEELALKFYEDQGYKGFYLENYLWTAIFGLTFWDIIFSSRPGVFFNPFQREPKDLRTEEFYRLREKDIHKRLKEVATDEHWGEKLLFKYREKDQTANHMVSWKRFSLKHLTKFLAVVPREHMVHILEHMAKNPGQHCSGFPDLFIYHPRRKEYRMMEVKGPGDQLQASQKRWLKFFKKNDIPYGVVRVEWK